MAGWTRRIGTNKRPFAKSMSKAKHWCFTLNNYEQTDIHKLNDFSLHEDCQYIIYGREVGENGTPHLQGYVCLRSRARLNQLRQYISDRAHFEIARGTPSQAADYCKKDGNYAEFGTIPKQKGTRSDLLAVQERIKQGATRDQIRDEFFNIYAKYPRAIELYIADLQQPREWETEVIVFWGKTGKGKTKAVFDFIARDKIYIHPGDQWFDGYNGQPVALFDDFNGSEFKLSYLLKLLDRYPMKVPIKGSYVNWVPKHIFITSNKDPKEWYSGAHEEQRNALFRRIKSIRHFE